MKNMVMMEIIKEYLQRVPKNTAIFLKLKPTTLLLNPQSPIIAMNIAHTLYLLKKY